MAEYRLKIHPDFYKNYGPDRYGRPTMSGVSDGQQAQWDARRASLAELAQQIREGRGGQGDVDHMVGERMNPLTTAAMFVGGAPATVGQTATAAAFTLGSMAGIEALAERHPTAAKFAQVGLMAAGIPGAGRLARRIAGRAFNDAMSEPTAQKVNLLKAMLDAYAKTGQPISEESAAALGPSAAAGADLAAAAARRAREAPRGAIQSLDDLRPRRKPAAGRGFRFEGPEDQPGKAPYVVNPASGKPAVPASAKQGPLPSKGPAAANGKNAPPPAEPFDPAELLTQKPLPPSHAGSTWSKPDQAAQDRWYSRLKARFGEDLADAFRSTYRHQYFDRYFYGDNPEATLGLYKKYETLRGIYDKIAEPNKILLGGSSSIGSEGTILRNEIGHDLDFQANIANASGRTDIGTPEATAAMVAALKNRANVENAPVIQKLRRLYPQLADAKFRYAERKFQWWGDDKYQPDVFTVPIPEPSTTPTGEVNLMVNVLLDGQKVDLMLTDSAMLPSKANPRLGRAQTALHWKSAYLQEALAKGRPLTKGQMKHQADLARYREYSKDNMLVDPRSRRAQYAPFDFPENRLIDEDGMPVVGEMETFPGSGERIPVFMNAQGRILPAEDPNMLTTWYDPWFPQNNPRYANPPATRDTHPLVAIRGAEQFLRAPRGESTGLDGFPGRGFQHGEPAPGIGIYPANNPELLVDEIIKGGRWSTYRNGKHKDMIFYPREAVDPMADSGTVLHAEDAYWSNPWDFNTDGVADRAAALGTPDAVDALGRYFGRTAHIPEGQFTEIGNAYRNYLYERNPEGHYNQPPNAGIWDGYGESRHLGRVPDGTVVPGKLIDSDPEKARAMMLDLVRKGMFLLPAGAGALGSGDEETQQAAKAGDADRFAMSRNFLATDEVPETIFGIPVVAREEDYTSEDLAFFRKHPEAGGYYDLGGGEEQPPEEPAGERPVQAASKGGHLDVKGIRWRDYKYGDGGVRIDPNNIKGTGIAFDEAKDRMRVPKGREAEFAAYMDNLAKLYNPLVWDEKLDQPARQSPGSEIYYLYGPNAYLGKDPSRPASNLVPPNWRVDNRYARDYDFVAAFLAGAQPGINPEDGAWHMPDSGGKMPTHPGFSKESPYAKDPRWAPLAGDWTEDGKYVPGEAELKANPDLFHEDTKGGRTVHAAMDAGKPKKKIPPIVKGPIHYGPPPPPERGAYPGVANNPGNVEKHERRSDKTLFKGEIGDGVRPKRFANFSDPVDGLAAAATVLSRRAAGLAAKGLPFTIENYVPGYAPKSENDTEGYIKNLSKYSGFARDEELDPGNVDDMARLLKNVVRFESGVPNSEWFTDDEYRQAALAMQEGAVD